MIDATTECPSCKLYGLHTIGERFVVTPTEDYNIINSWDGTINKKVPRYASGAYRYRSCLSCEHTWKEIDG